MLLGPCGPCSSLQGGVDLPEVVQLLKAVHLLEARRHRWVSSPVWPHPGRLVQPASSTRSPMQNQVEAFFHGNISGLSTARETTKNTAQPQVWCQGTRKLICVQQGSYLPLTEVAGVARLGWVVRVVGAHGQQLR